MKSPELPLEPMAGAEPNALAALRQATAECHAAMERDVDWQKAFSSPSCYVELLRAFYRVVQPLECRLASCERSAGCEAGITRGDRLRCDIAAVESCYRLDSDGGSKSNFELSESFVVDQSSAWGVRYVLEGSALGGQILARQLQASQVHWAGHWLKNRGSDHAPAMDSYFVGRGAETGAAWREFCCELNNHLCNGRAIGLAAQAAVETFGFFHSSLVGKAVCVRQ